MTDHSDDADIRANLDAVRRRIERAALDAGRDPADVQVLLAAKTVPAARILVAVEAGFRLIGENRVQELAEKDAELAGRCERHFIGHLQSNKVNQVLRYVSCVQSVDRVDLADRLQRRLEVIDGSIDVLIQVNVSGETSKFGVAPDRTAVLARQVAGHDRLRVAGLMTIGLNSDDGGRVRTGYRRLRELRDELRDSGVDAPMLSMGMTGDLELAIAEGSTMVRLGTAVFGRRPTPSPPS